MVISTILAAGLAIVQSEAAGLFSTPLSPSAADVVNVTDVAKERVGTQQRSVTRELVSNRKNER